MKHLKYYAVAASLLCASVLVTNPASAQSDDEWQVSGALNLWVAGIQGTTLNGTDIDVSFSDILDSLDMALMGTLEARNSEWSMAGDILYLAITEETGATLPTGASVDVEVTGTVLNLIGGRSLSDTEDGRVDITLGARHLDMENKLKAVGPGAIFTADGDAWDVIVGLRGQRFIDDKWYIPYLVDVGAGDSDLTWQALAGAGYRYSWGDVVVAYRHMEWDFEDGAPIQDINFSGPIAQFKFYF